MIVKQLLLEMQDKIMATDVNLAVKITIDPTNVTGTISLTLPVLK
jgi:hypothetical protein